MKPIYATLAISLAISSLVDTARSAPVSPPTPHSSASGFEAHIVSGGIAAHVGPFAHAAGGNGGAYNSHAALANENEVVALSPQNPTPSLYVKITSMKAHASSTGVLLDSESWEGDSATDQLAVAINLDPLPPGGVHPSPFVAVTADEVKTRAGMNLVFPSAYSATGTAKIHNLTISGSALGYSTVHYSGSPAPNTVIYDSPTVTITLNAQTQSGLISCSPAPAGCTFTPFLIETDAVDIDLHRAPWRKAKYTGHIVIGSASARNAQCCAVSAGQKASAPAAAISPPSFSAQ